MTTKHTCGSPVFGRKTKGCPRCDELTAGAKPVRWNCTKVSPYPTLAQLQAHHAACKCGPVCTYGDW